MVENMIKHQKLIISFMILALIVCTAIMTSGCTDYKTYKDGLYAYSIQYPETWDLDSPIPILGIVVTNPEDNSNVKIQCSDISESLKSHSFEDIVQSEVSGLQFHDAGFIEDTDIIEEQFTTFNDHEAYEIEYTYKLLRQEYHVKSIYFIDEDYLFVLTYEATSDNYKDDLKAADKIMKSIEL